MRSSWREPTCVSAASQSRSACLRPGGMVTVKSSEGSEDGSGQGSSGTGESASDETGDSNGDSSGDTANGSNTPSVPAGSDLGEPEYVGIAAPEDIGLIFESTNTGGDGGTTEPVEPTIVASTSQSSGLNEVGGEAPGAPGEAPVSTEGDEAQPGAEESEPPSERHNRRPLGTRDHDHSRSPGGNCRGLHGWDSVRYLDLTNHGNRLVCGHRQRRYHGHGATEEHSSSRIAEPSC